MERQKKIKRGALFISSGETPPLIDKANYSLVNRYASMDIENRMSNIGNIGCLAGIDGIW